MRIVQWHDSLCYISHWRWNCRCRNTHDVEAYLAAKTRDVHFSTANCIVEEPPFVNLPSEDENMVDQSSPSIDLNTTCPVYATRGECRTGLKCRFLGGHARKNEEGSWEVTVDEEKKALSAVLEAELNFIGSETLKRLRTKKVRQLPLLQYVFSAHVLSSILTPYQTLT